MTTPHADLSRRVLSIVVVLVALVTACSLPTDERAVPYDVDDLRPGLTETTTTTTTSTTTTSIVPVSTEPGATTIAPETTTTLPIRTEPVTVYYTIGSSDDLQPVPFDRAAPVAEADVRQLLQSPPDGVSDFNLFSAVRTGMIDDVVVTGNVATIALDPTVLDRMSPSQERRAIAQIVLTYTSFRTPDQGNIGAVKFEAEGEPFEVFVPSRNGTSEPGDELQYTDFSELISTATAAPTTSTTTTTTTLPTTPVPASSIEVETTGG